MADIIELHSRIQELEAQMRAVTEHLKIVLLPKPKKYEVMTEKELTKVIPTVQGR